MKNSFYLWQLINLNLFYDNLKNNLMIRKKVIAIIPVRKNSLGIKNKNLIV